MLIRRLRECCAEYSINRHLRTDVVITRLANTVTIPMNTMQFLANAEGAGATFAHMSVLIRFEDSFDEAEFDNHMWHYAPGMHFASTTRPRQVTQEELARMRRWSCQDPYFYNRDRNESENEGSGN